MLPSISTQQRTTLPNAQAVRALELGRSLGLENFPVKRSHRLKMFINYRAEATCCRTTVTDRTRSPIVPYDNDDRKHADKAREAPVTGSRGMMTASTGRMGQVPVP